MPKYLFHGSYTEEGLKGLLKEGGSRRREAADQLFESLGGSVEANYYAFGENDFYIIADLPDNVSSIAVSLVVNAMGAVNVRTIVLLTHEEVDLAVKKTVEYRPPGQ